MNHPDPEGHLTDITLTALVRLRDAQLRVIENALQLKAPGPYYTRLIAQDVVAALDAILEPWGEGTISDD